MGFRMNTIDRKMRLLTIDEMEQIYNKHMILDFPKSELKSIEMIKKAYEKEQYYAYGLFEGPFEDSFEGDTGNLEKLISYAFFIRSKNTDTDLLDYFAVVNGMRSGGIGSDSFSRLKKIYFEKNRHFILEVENPDYEQVPDKKAYMIKRIGFYKKNGMNVSNVTCWFFENEYKILYAGDIKKDEELQAEVDNIYREFFGDEFVNKKVVFH